jgi:hypothetical protein
MEEVKYGFVDPSHLQGKLSSKKDWLSFFLNLLEGYFLPSFSNTKLRFIKDVLAGDKKLLKSADIRVFNIPSFDEFKIANMMSQVREDPKIMMHLNYYEGSPLPEKEFFYGVIGTFAPNYLEEAIRSANRTRNVKDTSSQDLIQVNASLWKKLEAEPFLSSIFLRLTQYIL